MQGLEVVIGFVERVRVPGHFLEIVDEPDRAKGQRDKHQHPDESRVEPRPEDRRRQKSAKNQNASHRRRARLRLDMAFRPIVADWLALFLLRPQKVDQRAAKEEPEHQGGKKRTTCPVQMYKAEVPESEGEDGEKIPAVPGEWESITYST